MAIDVQFVLHMPFIGPTVPETLYKVVTMPVTPRTNDEVHIDGRYLNISRIRYRENAKPEAHFDDGWALLAGDWNQTAADTLADNLQTNEGYEDTSPWDV